MDPFLAPVGVQFNWKTRALALGRPPSVSRSSVPRVREHHPEIPGSIDLLIAQMLSGSSAERPRDAQAVLEALDGWVAGDLRSETERPSSPPRRERRLFSVIAVGDVDLSQSDRTLDQDAPNPDITLLSRLAERHSVQLIVATHGATLVFSNEGSATDLAQRAARCALTVRQALPHARIVLTTGRGSNAFMATECEEIVRAEQLLRTVAPSADTLSPVRLDKVTAGLLGAHFDVRGDVDHSLSLYGEQEIAEVPRTVLGRVTPFVGRRREMEQLAGIFSACCEERAAFATLIVADAGEGKSRLCAEWLRVLRRSDDLPEILVWRGNPVNAGSPFGLIATSVRRAAGVRDGEPREVCRNRLLARLERHLTGERLARVAEFLGELAGIPMDDTPSPQVRAARQDAMLMGDQVRQALVDWLDAECRAGPLVWVLEDIHWSDKPSLDCIDAALNQFKKNRPWMILATARPEVRRLFPGLWSRHAFPNDQSRTFVEIPLGPLNEAPAESLVRSVLGPVVAADAVASLLRRAGRNPLLLEEFIRATVSGREVPHQGSLIAILHARIEQIAPEARRVLLAASVFGETFWRDGVAAVVGEELPGGTLHRWCDELIDRELIEARPSSRFQSQHEYAFLHAAIREAAYAMYNDQDRATDHGLAGEWLVRAGEPDADVLAEHFVRSHAPDRAAPWFQAAAVRALSGDDLDAVIVRVERGIRCGAQGEVRGALFLSQAEVLRWRGKFHETMKSAREALRALPRGTARWCAAIAELAFALHRRGKFVRLARLGNALRQQPPREDDRSAWMIASARVATLLFHCRAPGAVEVAADLAELLDGLNLSVDDRDPLVAARVHLVRAFRAFHAGNLTRQLTHVREARVAFERAGDRRNACLQRMNHGTALLYFGRYEEAERELLAALATARDLRLASIEPSALQGLGRALAHLGRHDEARRVAHEAVEMFRSQRSFQMEAVARGELAAALLLADRPEDAAREAALAAALREATPYGRVYALAKLSQAQHAAGDPTAALETLRPFREAPVDLGDSGWIEQTVRLAAAEALRALGREEEARREIEAARDFLLRRAEAMDDPELRAAFLENVPENARVLECARAWA